MRLRHDHGEELELEWSEMLRGVEEEQRVAKSTPFMDMFRGNDLRRTLLSYGMMASQTASGVWFFIGYQTYFFSIAGITNAFEYSIMNACIGWIGVHCGIYAMKRWVGRRTLIIFGALTCGFCELACGIAASVSPNSLATGNVLVAFTALFMFFYDACVGVAAYPLANELVSSRLRAWTVGSGNALGYFLAWLVGFCSPYFINPQDLNWVSEIPSNTEAVSDSSSRVQNTLTSGPCQTSSVSSSSTCAFLSPRAVRSKNSMRSSRPRSRLGSFQSINVALWRMRGRTSSRTAKLRSLSMKHEYGIGQIER